MSPKVVQKTPQQRTLFNDIVTPVQVAVDSEGAATALSMLAEIAGQLEHHCLAAGLDAEALQHLINTSRLLGHDYAASQAEPTGNSSANRVH